MITPALFQRKQAHLNSPPPEHNICDIAPFCRFLSFFHVLSFFSFSVSCALIIPFSFDFFLFIYVLSGRAGQHDKIKHPAVFDQIPQ